MSVLSSHIHHTNTTTNANTSTKPEPSDHSRHGVKRQHSVSISSVFSDDSITFEDALEEGTQAMGSVVALTRSGSTRESRRQMRARSSLVTQVSIDLQQRAKGGTV